ncbi:hypothetical protein [Paenibacillus bovis]|uniref:Uncharacterized protein n=1 Tax=Paenibacillus bovis TaxID=1616788 RepID=A0A172ZCI6_9BACL|nr:hypothetical protein [Paenibacillus bovis]ANF95328.1 hypothetical protein AR543_04385 [Paenibacillus bovis]
MSILRLFSLRNLLLACCAVGLVLVIIKSIGIYHKISWVKLADQYYAQQQWVPAQEWYSRANNNRYFTYQEQHIANRLNELEPITAWKDTVSASASELQAATDTQQFDSFVNAYKRWAQHVEQQRQADTRFQKEYNQIQQQYQMRQLIQTGFTNFRNQFETGLQQNLAQGNYTDESYKWNLLRIPTNYWDTKEPRDTYIRNLLQTYDQTKLKRLAAAGDFDAFLNQASMTVQAYQQHSYEAPWVTALAENGARSVIAKDIEAGQNDHFISHARSFMDTADQIGLQSSSVLTQINRQIGVLQDQASGLSAQGQFQQALSLYESLSTLEDMSEPIARTQIAWATADPAHLLQSSNASVAYQHITGGVNWEDVPVYSLATDSNNRLFFGQMTADGAASVWSGEIGESAAAIQALSLETRLSSREQPVVLVQSDSGTTGYTQYSLYTFTGSEVRKLLSVAAVSYEVDADRSIIIHQPLEGAPGQTDVYTPAQDGSYTLSDRRTDDTSYLSVSAGEVSSHLNEPLQFSAEIVSVDADGALAKQGDSYVRLTGDLEFTTGTFTIYGRFTGNFVQMDSSSDERSGSDTPESPNSSTGTNNTDQTETDGNSAGMPDEDFEPEYGLGDTTPAGPINGAASIPVVEVDRIQ